MALFAFRPSRSHLSCRVLTGIPIDSVQSLQQVLRIFHRDYKVPHVVISSVPLQGKFLKTLPAWLRRNHGENDQELDATLEPLMCIASTLRDDDDHISSVHAFQIPRIPGYFSGVGDLFSALVLGHFNRPGVRGAIKGTPLSQAVYKACRTTHGILWRTHLYSMSLPAEERTASDEELDTKDPERKVRRMKGRELRLIQEQNLITDHYIDVAEQGVEENEEWTDFWK